MSSSFSSLSLSPAILETLNSLGYQAMTPIQAQSLPLILKGKDVIAQGQTGSGKTAAFGLGVISRLQVKKFTVQSLILCPTRELADQVAKEIRRLGRGIPNIKVLTLCGGMPLGPQIGSLRHGAHIVVGTPGRVELLSKKGVLPLKDVSTFVLDEADRMLEMGFQPSLETITRKLPRQRQTLLFSATFPEGIESLSTSVMKAPERVEVASTHDVSSIRQYLYEVSSHAERRIALQKILLEHQPESAVVFCTTKQETAEIAAELRDKGFAALGLHGDLDQRQRDQNLVRFANKSIRVLVATDVAARGLDIDDLDMVVNYHLSRDPEVHTHRIGRTGRAGKSGVACSLFSSRDRYKVEQIEAYADQILTQERLPSDTLLRLEPEPAKMVTLQIDGGKKQKLRPGDILGALTKGQQLTGQQIGKISLFDYCAYVAVPTELAGRALKQLSNHPIKGKAFRVRLINR